MKYDRIVQMKQLFLQKKHLTNNELCETFDISIGTLRRDLALLEKDGVIKKVYGGAILIDDNIMPASMPPWDTRSVLNLAAKHAIAREIVNHISDNAIVALDSGTTTLEVAKLLNQKKNLTILTNCMHIAIELSMHSDHMIYYIGGAIKKDEFITTGFLANDFLTYFSHIDIAVLSGDGFCVSEGMSDYSVEMGTLKASIIGKSDKIYAAIDSSKFSIKALYRVCATDRFDLIVTDDNISKADLDALRSKKIKVIPVPVAAD